MNPTHNKLAFIIILSAIFLRGAANTYSELPDYLNKKEITFKEKRIYIIMNHDTSKIKKLINIAKYNDNGKIVFNHNYAWIIDLNTDENYIYNNGKIISHDWIKYYINPDNNNKRLKNKGTYKYKYDKEGNLIELKQIDSNNKIMEEFIYSYNNKLIDKQIHNQFGLPKFEEKDYNSIRNYEYDKKYLIKEKIYYKNDVKGIILYKRNLENILTEILYINKNDSLEEKHQIEYDENINPIKINVFKKNKIIYNYIFNWNENGDIKEEILESPNKKNEKIIYLYEYIY